jgi:hypothetical protein
MTERLDIEKDTPRVEACINEVMRRFPGGSASAQARYFEEVHQHLAPLARQLERELAEAKAAQQAAWDQLAAARRASLQADEGKDAVLRLFMGAAYPVAPEINPRGYNWSEAYLDQARAVAIAAKEGKQP